MGWIIDKIKRRRPVIGNIIGFFVQKATEEVVTYPDGTQETVKYGDGILRDKVLVTAVATGLIGLFHWSIEASDLADILLKAIELLGTALTAKFARDKYELKAT
jgi:hypothetical protein